jgi:uncharacterized membrane protein YfcA
VITGLVLLGGGAAAGVFGSLLGLGGGILIVPMLTLGFGVPLREAVAASLVSVIVTSSASAAVYLQRHVANLRLGMTLELFSAIGALVGGVVAFMIDERLLAGLFALLLAWVAVSMARRRDPQKPAAPTGAAAVVDDAVTATAAEAAPVMDPDEPPVAGPEASRPIDHDAAPILDAAPSPSAAAGSFTASLSGPGYMVHSLPAGAIGSVFAGLNSALLGVGGGIIKVPVMNLLMGVPLRTSTATSNMMMGITAVSSAVIYLLNDQVDPFIAGPIALGVFVGASVGSRVSHRVDVRILRWLFVVVLVYTAAQMALRALGL